MKQQIETDVSNSARTSGRPSLSEISLVKRSDQSSIKLYEACLKAKPVGAGSQLTKILVACGGEENGTSEQFLTVELTDALVSSIETQTDSKGLATDIFTLNFTEIRWLWSSHGNDNSDQNSVDTGWSVARNRPC